MSDNISVKKFWLLYFCLLSHGWQPFTSSIFLFSWCVKLMSAGCSNTFCFSLLKSYLSVALSFCWQAFIFFKRHRKDIVNTWQTHASIFLSIYKVYFFFKGHQSCSYCEYSVLKHTTLRWTPSLLIWYPYRFSIMRMTQLGSK